MREHVVHFLNFIGAHADDADLGKKDFSNSLTQCPLILVCESEVRIGA